MIKLKRIYNPASDDEGARVLVDRLWPRGISKERAQLDLWLKEIAPSEELRKWFGHNVDRWQEFKAKYLVELKNNQSATDKLRKILEDNKTATLLYAARDQSHNEAVVIKEYLEDQA